MRRKATNLPNPPSSEAEAEAPSYDALYQDIEEKVRLQVEAYVENLIKRSKAEQEKIITQMNDLVTRTQRDQMNAIYSRLGANLRPVSESLRECLEGLTTLNKQGQFEGEKMINARLQVVEDQVEQAKKVDDGVRKRIKKERQAVEDLSLAMNGIKRNPRKSDETLTPSDQAEEED